MVEAEKNKCGVHALILDLEVVGGGEKYSRPFLQILVVEKKR